MKNKNILILIISFIILLVACSALSMSAVASNYRYTWVAMYADYNRLTPRNLVAALRSYSPDLHQIIFIRKSIHHSCTLINSFVLCKFATSKNDRDRVI